MRNGPCKLLGSTGEKKERHKLSPLFSIITMENEWIIHGRSAKEAHTSALVSCYLAGSIPLFHCLLIWRRYISIHTYTVVCYVFIHGVKAPVPNLNHEYTFTLPLPVILYCLVCQPKSSDISSSIDSYLLSLITHPQSPPFPLFSNTNGNGYLCHFQHTQRNHMLASQNKCNTICMPMISFAQ